MSMSMALLSTPQALDAVRYPRSKGGGLPREGRRRVTWSDFGSRKPLLGFIVLEKRTWLARPNSSLFSIPDTAVVNRGREKLQRLLASPRPRTCVTRNKDRVGYRDTLGDWSIQGDIDIYSFPFSLDVADIPGVQGRHD